VTSAAAFGLHEQLDIPRMDDGEKRGRCLRHDRLHLWERADESLYLFFAGNVATTQEEPASAGEKKRVSFTRAHANRFVFRQNDPASRRNIRQPDFVQLGLGEVIVMMFSDLAGFDERLRHAAAETAADKPGDDPFLHAR